MTKLTRVEGKFKFDLLESRGNKCMHCGSKEKIDLKLIVPESAGGKWLESNIVVLCRSCEMAIDSVTRMENNTNRKAINFWVSSKLYNYLQQISKHQRGFSSMGSLVRYLMQKYVENPDKFEDLDQYQSIGADVKINVWVGSDIYEEFKKVSEKNDRTVTETIKALIIIYETEAENVLNK